MPLEVVGTM